ncbi:MAG: universal stress protein [Chakrabartia sp.]
MRTYLAVVDGTEEAEIAVRFAARRAAKTGGGLHILAIVEQQEFVAFGSIQATIEAEAEDRAEEVARRALDMLDHERGVIPRIIVKQGEAIHAIQQVLAENPDIGALVLGAAKSGAPGPLISHFAGAGMTSLPCPLMIIPGTLSREGLDRLS